MQSAIYRIKNFLRNSFMQDRNENITLIMVPEAGVTEHFLTACYLAKTLEENGDNIRLFHCENSFSRCVVKNMNKITAFTLEKEVKQICYNCNNQFHKNTFSYGLNYINVENLIDSITKKELLELNQKIKNSLWEFNYENIQFGRLCCYDVQLMHKVSDIKNAELGIKAILADVIFTAVKMYVVINKMISQKKIEKIIYFNDYSVNLGARLAADKNHIPSYTFSNGNYKGVDRTKWVISRKMLTERIYTDINLWPKYKNYPLLKSEIDKIIKDSIFRFTAPSHFVYSPRISGKKEKSKPGQKIITVFTSSADETGIIETLAALNIKIPKTHYTFGSTQYNCQIAWLKSLIEFACRNKEIAFRIRVHPREGANHRESISSEHLIALKNLFLETPCNVNIMWPDSKISSYDLFNGSDVVLTSWSFIGLEAARLGIPVLECTRGINGFPVNCFSFFEKTPQRYYKKLSSLLVGEYNKNDIIKNAFRWSAFYSLSNTIDVSDVITPNFSGSLQYRAPNNKIVIVKSMLNDSFVRKTFYMNHQVKRSIAKEKVNLASAYRKLANVLKK